MSLLSDLLAYPGAQGVGEYPFHGDRPSFHHRGEPTDRYPFRFLSLAL